MEKSRGIPNSFGLVDLKEIGLNDREWPGPLLTIDFVSGWVTSFYPKSFEGVITEVNRNVRFTQSAAEKTRQNRAKSAVLLSMVHSLVDEIPGSQKQ